MKTNLKKALSLFQPNSEMFSDWVSVELFNDAGLNWGDNGNLRRNTPWGLTELLWQVKRVAGPRSRVTHLRMVGINEQRQFNQRIRADIVSELRSTGICNISLLPVPEQDKEVDHRWGYKEADAHADVMNTCTQSVDDFQLLHRCMNLIKREACKKCRETGCRYVHPEKPFVQGDEVFTSELGCVGCYLAQPERYR